MKQRALPNGVGILQQTPFRLEWVIDSSLSLQPVERLWHAAWQMLGATRGTRQSLSIPRGDMPICKGQRKKLDRYTSGDQAVFSVRMKRNLDCDGEGLLGGELRSVIRVDFSEEVTFKPRERGPHCTKAEGTTSVKVLRQK